MWQADLSTEIKAAPKKVWQVLVTPSLWTKVDPEHYKEVTYAEDKLTIDTKGSMKTQDSPFTFKFSVAEVNDEKYQVVTTSQIPAGKLTLSKTIETQGKICIFHEHVEASGPFAKLFAKLFFEKQIAGTLQEQHQRIKDYVEK